MNRKKVVVIGGGTGTYTVLSGLRKYPLDLSVIVSMMDDGGSNRVIRDEFGLLPTSDLRQCMVALASGNSNDILRKLFTYRYNQGTGISGMTFGNLFMAALTDIYNADQEKAIEETCKILGVKGKIIPVTYDKAHLVARYENGQQVLGEHQIDEPEGSVGIHKIVELEVFPKVKVNPKALKAIKEADFIVFGPGDLHTSIICNFVIEKIAEAIAESKAKKIYILNLMTKFGQTNNFTAKDHIEELEKYLGSGTIDYCLINKTIKFPRGILKKYIEEKAFPIKDDTNGMKGIKIVRKDLISKAVYLKPKSDKLTRSLIRHDSAKLAKALVALLN